MFKRILSLMLVLAMLFSFTACASDDSDSEDTSSSTAIVTSSEESEDTSSESSSASSSESTETEEETEEETESQGGTGTQSSFSITKQPQNTSVTAGETLTLSLTASGTGLSYQWYTSLSPSGENAVKLDGQTESSLAIYTKDVFVQYYYCVVSKTGTVTQIKSNIVTASANGTGVPAPIPVPAPLSDVPTITNQPLNTSYSMHQTATALSVTATIPSGNGTLSYQWFSGTPASGTEISGETSSTYTPSTTTQGSKTYYCVVTNTLTDGTTHEVTSSVATIEVVNNDNNIWVAGIQVTAENSLNILGDSSASVQFDRTTNTLTLNNANISYDGTGDETAAIHSSLTDDLIINLIGENKITNTGSDSSNGNGYDAIDVNNDLTIKGDGSLTATGGNSDDVGCGGFGISANSALEISGYANVTAIGGSGLESGLGIRIERAAKISENATVITAGGYGGGGDGIYANSTLEISGEATVIATGGDGNGENRSGGSGIFIYSKLEILGEAKVTARAGNSLNGLTRYGIYMNDEYSEFNIGTESVPFAGTLTAVAGTSGRGVAYAFYNNAITNFGTEMKYYTSTDGTTWTEGGLASSLPANHKDNIGLYFGTSAPT